MAKKNFQKTPLERAQHEKAVKVRKMTDSQLCEFIDTLSDKAQANNTVENFIQHLQEHGYRGIGTATLAKIKSIALKAGFIKEV